MEANTQMQTIQTSKVLEYNNVASQAYQKCQALPWFVSLLW